MNINISSETSFPNEELKLNDPLDYNQIYSYNNFEVPGKNEVIQIVGNLLNRLIKTNESLNIETNMFHSKNVPSISIDNYILRLGRYSKCSTEVMIMTLLYIDRYIEKQESQQISLKNVHKLFFVSFVIACKYNDDLKLANKDFAKLGGVHKLELVLLETQFLKDIDFEVEVSSQDYFKYLKSLLQFFS